MIRPATAFRFKDRIFGSGQSLDTLFEVLGKWKNGESMNDLYEDTQLIVVAEYYLDCIIFG